jgi:hypothetical protein
MTQNARHAGGDAGQHLVVVSSDTHIGPLLAEQLRDYCPKRYLEDFDEFARAYYGELEADDNVPNFILGLKPGIGSPNLDSLGHHDINIRLKEMDADGVAAEVIFHNSQNGQPMPFRPQNWSRSACTSTTSGLPTCAQSSPNATQALCTCPCGM